MSGGDEVMILTGRWRCRARSRPSHSRPGWKFQFAHWAFVTEPPDGPEHVFWLASGHLPTCIRKEQEGHLMTIEAIVRVVVESNGFRWNRLVRTKLAAVEAVSPDAVLEAIGRAGK